jgi:hypothetical protein
MSEAELFFIGEAIRHAKRNLSLEDAITFLDGMIATAGKDHPAYVRLVLAKDHFNSGDAQLELIASGQLKFELPADSRPPVTRL